MHHAQEFAGREFLSIETFRKSGVGVRTPMWFAEDGGEFLLWTDVNSGKVRRIRNNPEVRIAPCSRFGDVTGEWVAGRASIDETPEAVGRVASLLRRKVGLPFLLFRQIDRIRDRRNDGRRVCVRISIAVERAGRIEPVT